MIAALVAVWLVVKASDDFSQFVTVTLNGLSLSALYFVVASGFTLIFGLMRVVNMAHGSLYLLGGYLALNFQEKLFQKDDGGLNLSLTAGGGGGGGDYNIIGWVVPLLMSVLIIGVIGILLQQLFLRWNQGQDLRQALITIATIATRVGVRSALPSARGSPVAEAASTTSGRPPPGPECTVSDMSLTGIES